MAEALSMEWLIVLFMFVIPMILYIGCCAPQEERSGDQIEEHE